MAGSIEGNRMSNPCEACRKVCIRSTTLCPHCGRRFSGPDERPCYFMDNLADGKIGRRERLAKDVPTTGLEDDYKTALAEMGKVQERYFRERSDIVRETVTGLKERVLLTLVLAGYPDREIMAVLGVSKSTYYRLKKG